MNLILQAQPARHPLEQAQLLQPQTAAREHLPAPAVQLRQHELKDLELLTIQDPDHPDHQPI